MLSTCAKLLQSLRYFGLHFPQVPHTYSVSQPLSSHVSLSRNRHRRIAEIHVQDKGSTFHWFYVVNLCKTASMIDMWDRISKVFLCSLSSDPHNISKTSIVTCYTYTQNLNYNTVHVYGKLDTLYGYWNLEFLRVVHATSVYIRKTWIVTRYIY